MSMGPKLAQARKQANLTQEQLAERLGVTRQAVSRWESDTAYPETDKIVRMAQILNVSCDYLLRDGETEKKGAVPASPVTRLLRDAAGRRVKLSLYEGDDIIFTESGMPGYDWCIIQDFDGGWANVEFAKKTKRETRLISLSDIRAITFLKDKEGQA